MKKLAILCALACALVACEKPNNEEAGEKQFSQAVQKDLEVLNGTFAKIVFGITEETITFIPFSQPIRKIGSQSGEVIDMHGTFEANDWGASYFYIKPASSPQKSEIFIFEMSEDDADHYIEETNKYYFYYTIIDKDTIITEGISPKISTTYTRI